MKEEGEKPGRAAGLCHGEESPARRQTRSWRESRERVRTGESSRVKHAWHWTQSHVNVRQEHAQESEMSKL